MARFKKTTHNEDASARWRLTVFVTVITGKSCSKFEDLPQKKICISEVIKFEKCGKLSSRILVKKAVKKRFHS